MNKFFKVLRLIVYFIKKIEGDATLTRIQQTKGIEGTLVLNQEGDE